MENLENILKEFHRKLGEGLKKEDIEKLVNISDSRINEKGYHFDFALALEKASLYDIAFRELNLARRDEPDNPRIMSKLSEYLLERGEIEKASSLLLQLVRFEDYAIKALETLCEISHTRGDIDLIEQAKKISIECGIDREKVNSITKITQNEFDSFGIIESGETEGIARYEEPEKSIHKIEEFPIPSDEDIIRFLHLFSGREDVYAKGWYNSYSGKGGYSPVHEPLTPRVLRQHFLGDISVGVYCLRLDGTVTFFAFDIDITKKALERVHSKDEGLKIRNSLRKAADTVAKNLEKFGMNYLLETSGFKGFHVWCFLEEPLHAEIVYNFGKYFLKEISNDLPLEIGVEFFPKQPRKGDKGFSNLIKIPLGIHPRTGKRSRILEADLTPVPKQFDAFKKIKYVSKSVIFSAIESLKLKNLGALDVGAGAKKDKTQSSEVSEQEIDEIIGSGVQKSAPEIFNEGKTEFESVAEYRGPATPPVWSEIDFEEDIYISHLLHSCPVLSALKEKVDLHGALEYDEVVVLQHTLGHLPSGILAVNYLFSRCVNLQSDAYLKSVLQGNPISCPKIRARIPHITSKLNCFCKFDNKNHYPTPLLHLDSIVESKGTPAYRKVSAENAQRAKVDVEELSRKFLRTMSLKKKVEIAFEEIKNYLWETLMQTMNNSIELEEGIIKAKFEDGVKDIEFIPKEPHPSNSNKQGDNSIKKGD